MARNARPSLPFILFLAAMGLIIAVGLFMLVYGSVHNVLPAPSLPGGGLFARLTSHG